jgi:hypothetical protein
MAGVRGNRSAGVRSAGFGDIVRATLHRYAT